jgi:phosphatidylglycerol:prolipoprotein diacylglycerol transferase
MAVDVAPALWALAIIAALAYVVHLSGPRGLDRRTTYWAGVAAILGGLCSAHWLGCAVHGVGDPLAWLEIWSGGNSYFGGLFGGALAGYLVIRSHGASARAYADASVPAIALGYAIGRVGCFLNGDDFGSLTNVPWAVRYPSGTEAHAAHAAWGWIGPADPLSLPVHPVQLYASLLGLILFVVLARMDPRRPAARLAVFTAGYGVGRFALETLRGDFVAVWGPFSLPQLFSLALVLISLLVCARTHSGLRRSYALR